jgi:hypothetical protein
MRVEAQTHFYRPLLISLAAGTKWGKILVKDNIKAFVLQV